MDRFEHSDLWQVTKCSVTLERKLQYLEDVDIPLVSLTDTVETPKPKVDTREWGRSRSRRYSGAWSPQASVSHRGRGGPTHVHVVQSDSIFGNPDGMDGQRIYAPTEKSLKCRAAKVRDLCVGVCLDCVKGCECRDSHRHGWKSSGRNDGWGPNIVDFDGNGPSIYKEIEEFDVDHDIEYSGYWEKCW